MRHAWISENVVPFVLKPHRLLTKHGRRECECVRGTARTAKVSQQEFFARFCAGRLLNRLVTLTGMSSISLSKHADYLSEHRSEWSRSKGSYINALQSCVSLEFYPQQRPCGFIDGGMRRTTTQMSDEKIHSQRCETACTILNMMVDMPTQRQCRISHLQCHRPLRRLLTVELMDFHVD